MIVTFAQNYLKELYEQGTTKDKNHRFQPDIIKRYKRCIHYLMSASSKESLFPINSLRFEALSGDKAGLFSVRVNDKYRIEFTLEESADKPLLTICNIVELSNHYD
ncbi:MAG: type II toxin-antitoxin system RelE/ParE family toxin [Muribaculaceae bacterium]